jgi:formylglycine-generating enzyme
VNYPVRVDQTPNNYPPPGDQHSVNFFNAVFSAGKPYFLTEVDAYQFASSYYGTYDQGGNVWEWLENWRLVDRGNEPVRGLRGGSATYTEIGVHAANTDPGNPSHKKFVWGGRIAKAHVTSSDIVLYSDSSYIVRCWNTRKFRG